MNDTQGTTKAEGDGGKWPDGGGGAVSGPVTTAALANAAARAAASSSRRDLLEYLRMRRRAGA